MRATATTCQRLFDIGSGPERVRNVCILAHVDHGKTTIVDSLLASNGLISRVMAGKLRYMDSREDEQIRGITMKSSSISLHHCITSGEVSSEYLVNFIDSPGHVDFCSEVQAAVRICDGAVVVVDAVEGVRAQTVAALNRVQRERLQLIVVINKIDRLITDLRLTTEEAYIRLTKIFETLNATVANQRSQNENVEEQDDAEESEPTIFPTKSNVIFASAIGSWAFSLGQFAKMYSEKFKFCEDVLRRKLWGDYYIDKAKKVKRGAQAKGHKPLFVSMILDQIWALFQAISDKRIGDVERMCNSLRLRFTPRMLAEPDLQDRIQQIFGQWLPLSTALLDSIVANVPDPTKLSLERVNWLMSGGERYDEEPFRLWPSETFLLREAMTRCDGSETAEVIAYVSKFVAVNECFLGDMACSTSRQSQAISQYNAEKRKAIIERLRTANADHDVAATTNGMDDHTSPGFDSPPCVMVLVGFARLYSGRIRLGQTLYLLWPRHVPRDGKKSDSSLEPYADKVEIEQVYIMMGREYLPVPFVSAGNVFAFRMSRPVEIRGKSAALSSTTYCPPLTTKRKLRDLPLIHVSLEALKPGEIDQLRCGARRLRQSDPAVELKHLSTGELVMCVSGEVHLERCLKDLRECFCSVEFTVSEPMVPFRETLILPTKGSKQWTFLPRIPDGGGSVLTRSFGERVQVSIIPLPDEVISVLEEPETDLSRPDEKLKDKLKAAFESACSKKSRALIPGFLDSIWAFGKRHAPCNILINRDPTLRKYYQSIWQPDSSENSAVNGKMPHDDDVCHSDSNSQDEDAPVLSRLRDALINGFNVALLHGPLCDEPLTGVCVAIERLEDLSENAGHLSVSSEVGSNTSSYCGIADSSAARSSIHDYGQLIFAIKDACNQGFCSWPDKRLVLAMYRCDIQCPLEAIGRLYPIIGRRHGQVIGEDMAGCNLLVVTALIPVAESFGFVSEVWAETSGVAMPQMVFDHWEVLDEDPQVDDRESAAGRKMDLDEDNDYRQDLIKNRAREYVNAVRRRKGLRVNEVIVKYAEKQRTLGRNK